MVFLVSDVNVHIYQPRLHDAATALGMAIKSLVKVSKLKVKVSRWPTLAEVAVLG
jgi:hypothetical protein